MNIRRKIRDGLYMFNGIMDNIGYEEHEAEFNDTDATSILKLRLENAAVFAKERLDTYYECGHVNNDMLDDDPRMWKQHVAMLSGFISVAKSTLHSCR